MGEGGISASQTSDLLPTERVLLCKTPERGLEQEIKIYEQAISSLEMLNIENANQYKANVAIRLGNTLLDSGLDSQRVETLFLDAANYNPLMAFSNLFWLYISTGQSSKANQELGQIDGIPVQGRELIYSALAFSVENFGEATEHLYKALSEKLVEDGFDFTDDLERLLRLVIAKDFGERLIKWFEMTRFSERYAPIFIAFIAAIRGEQMVT